MGSSLPLQRLTKKIDKMRGFQPANEQGHRHRSWADLKLSADKKSAKSKRIRLELKEMPCALADVPRVEVLDDEV